MTPLKCAKKEGHNDIVETIENFIKLRPKQQRKQRELFKDEKVQDKKIQKFNVNDDEQELVVKTNANNEKSKDKKKKKTFKDQVCETLGLKATEIDKVSRCLLAGLKKGHIKLTLGLDTVILKSNCLICEQKITCTVRDIMYQSD